MVNFGRLGDMKHLFYLLFFACSISIVSLNSGCKKINSFSKDNLTFSTDTIVFDTVFTTIGSTTKSFKIYNPSNKPLKIDDIELMGGSNSVFRMNVDGIAQDYIENISIEGKDSLYVFVEVTLDPNNQTLPMVVEDSIRFRTNGEDQFVQLAAWGQDAYFHYSSFQSQIFDLNEGVWPNDKPHVIYGAAFVDSSKNLVIQAGTQVHLHKNAILYVYKGSLNVNGTLGNEVVFQGDRLEAQYQDITGQYYGIYFQQALPSSIEYAIMKNGTVGVHLYGEDPSNLGYTLQLNNTRIFNESRYGVFIYSGAKVKAENCLISRNESHALLVLEGGDFNFNHCNLVGYGNAQVPAVGISNYFSNNATGITTVGSIGEGTLTNCVIAGNLNNELVFDTLNVGGVVLNFNVNHCLIRNAVINTDPFFTSNIWNENPLFEDTAQGDFLFLINSPLNNQGVNSSVTVDILGSPRNNPPDIGAVEVN